MTFIALVAIDLLAIAVLAFGLYYRRHRRRDLVIAFLVVNVGVMAVSLVLASSAVGVGLGLGLFGVLSIIRLRSYEIAQHEVAYYFAALALGLLAGLGTTAGWSVPALMGLVLLVMLLGDSRRMFARNRQQVVTLDAAIADEEALRRRLEELLGARVHVATVQRLDLVNDTTTVDVRYELPRVRPNAGLVAPAGVASAGVAHSAVAARTGVSA